MNWDAISAISETIASAAVVLSLIYLSIQIRQANKQSQGQTRAELRHMAQAEVFKLIDYPEIGRSFDKEELTIDEKIRLHNFLIGALRFREFIWRQHQENLLDSRTFENYLMVIPQLLGSERNRRWWEDYKRPTFDPDFCIFVDTLLEKYPGVNYTDLYKSL